MITLKRVVNKDNLKIHDNQLFNLNETFYFLMQYPLKNK